jgi:hypothetical protein
MKRIICSQFSLLIIGIFASLAIHAQNTNSLMNSVILMNGGSLQIGIQPDGRKTEKAILPAGAKLNETTLPNGNKIQELTLSDGKKIQIYLNPNGSLIKKVATFPDGTIITNTIEGSVEHMTIQSPNGTVTHATIQPKK